MPHALASGFPSPCRDRGGQAPALREKTPPHHRRAWALACHTRMRAGFPRQRFAARPFTPVGQDRLILTRSGAGAPELQRWDQCLTVGRWARCLPVEGTSLSRYGGHRDQEVYLTGTSLASRPGKRDARKKSRPGGLSYGEGIDI